VLIAIPIAQPEELSRADHRLRGGPPADPAASQHTGVRQERAAPPSRTAHGGTLTERTARRWPGRKHIRRPRTRRGWLITIGASGAILALKVTLGLGVLALVVHLLTH
jgi:hypothetical protein